MAGITEGLQQYMELTHEEVEDSIIQTEIHKQVITYIVLPSGHEIKVLTTVNSEGLLMGNYIQYWDAEIASWETWYGKDDVWETINCGLPRKLDICE